MELPPLRALHGEGSLSRPKLEALRRLTAEDLLRSLLPGNPGCLKARPDGLVLDGHHRLQVLRERGIDVDMLPREVLVASETEKDP